MNNSGKYIRTPENRHATGDRIKAFWAIPANREVARQRKKAWWAEKKKIIDSHQTVSEAVNEARRNAIRETIELAKPYLYNIAIEMVAGQKVNRAIKHLLFHLDGLLDNGSQELHN